MSLRETALTFACQGETLVGVLAQGSQAGTRGVLVVVGGPQYRAGSHRQFTYIARALALAGLPTLRFDVRGMGDSTGPLHTFEHIGDDIDAALGALLQAQPGLRDVVLLGLCDGASAALMHVDAHRGDPRVAGLVLINPWVRSADTLAKAHVKHYYLQRLREPEFWRKLLRGQVAGAALRGLFDNLRLAFGGAKPAPADQRGFQQRMADGWLHGGAPVWLVLSGEDYTAKEFLTAWDGHPIWQPVKRGPAPRRLDLPGADHTFSNLQHQAALEQWLVQQLAPQAVAQRAPAGAAA